MFHTVVVTKDGVYVAVPNGPMWAKSVRNFSRTRPSCVEIDINVNRALSFKELRPLIAETIKAETMVSDGFNPLITIELVKIESMNMRALFWCEPENEQDARVQVIEKLREKLTAAGCEVIKIGLTQKKKKTKKKPDTSPPQSDEIM